jgi:hypothetical protein
MTAITTANTASELVGSATTTDERRRAAGVNLPLSHSASKAGVGRRHQVLERG